MADYIAGIDEAGRGPIIGPLVIAVAAIREDVEIELKALGVKDSKLLSEKQREYILKEFEKLVKFELIMIQPEEIDNSVLSATHNLNWLEADHGANLLNKLDVKLDNKVCKAYIDCPSVNISNYSKYFQQRVDNKETKLIVEHKADFNYLIVGAASIIAKVTREKELEKLKHRFKIDFGSGYPSDPKTKAFVEANWNNPRYAAIFRKSWATYQNVAKKNGQKSLDGF